MAHERVLELLKLSCDVNERKPLASGATGADEGGGGDAAVGLRAEVAALTSAVAAAEARAEACNDKSRARAAELTEARRELDAMKQRKSPLVEELAGERARVQVLTANGEQLQTDLAGVTRRLEAGVNTRPVFSST